MSVPGRQKEVLLHDFCSLPSDGKGSRECGGMQSAPRTNPSDWFLFPLSLSPSDND